MQFFTLAAAILSCASVILAKPAKYNVQLADQLPNGIIPEHTYSFKLSMVEGTGSPIQSNNFEFYAVNGARYVLLTRGAAPRGELEPTIGVTFPKKVQSLRSLQVCVRDRFARLLSGYSGCTASKFEIGGEVTEVEVSDNDLVEEMRNGMANMEHIPVSVSTGFFVKGLRVKLPYDLPPARLKAYIKYLYYGIPKTVPITEQSFKKLQGDSYSTGYSYEGTMKIPQLPAVRNVYICVKDTTATILSFRKNFKVCSVAIPTNDIPSVKAARLPGTRPDFKRSDALSEEMMEEKLGE